MICKHILVFFGLSLTTACFSSEKDLKPVQNNRRGMIAKIAGKDIPENLRPSEKLIKKAESRKNDPLFYDEEGDYFYKIINKNDLGN